MTQTTPAKPAEPDQASAGPQQGPRPEDNTRFFLVVALLMLLIIALLSGLWLRAHLRAARLEAQVISARASGAKMEDFLKAYVIQNPPAEFVRGQLATREAVLDGKATTLLRLSAEQAAKLGLGPGDLLVVDPPAADGPASMAAKSDTTNPSLGSERR